MEIATVSSFIADVSARLATGLVNEFFSLCRVEEYRKDLELNFEIIKGVLETAHPSISRTKQEKQWLSQLEEISMDVQDLLDEGVARIAQAKDASCISSFFLRFDRYGYASKLKAASNELKAVVNRKMLLLGDHPNSSARPPHHKDESHSSVPKVLVGVEDSRMKIVHNLIHKDFSDDVVVIPIIGMGGLGKTTLAQSVFECNEIRRHFYPRIWVDVLGEDGDVKSIIKKIVTCLTKENCDHLGMESLKERLWELLDGKRHLIVMDDMWNDDNFMWSNLRDLLIRGAKGSRLIVTTRKESVAEATRPGFTYKLRELSEDNSWELFKRFASKEQDVLADEQQNIGKEIVSKCFGVPLLIKSLGLLLHSKSVEEWRWIKDTDLKDIDQSERSVLHILRLSYNNLPLHLQICFLFCRLVRHGKSIDVHNLISLWAMLGLIDEDNYKDVGKSYVSELIRSSLLEHTESEMKMKSKTHHLGFVKMHDLINELCIVLSNDQIMVDNNGEKVKSNTRHLWLLSCEEYWKVPSAMLETKRNLRTLVLRNNLRQKQFNLIIRSFKKLRVLDVRGCWYIDKIPSAIAELVHLRYLDLSDLRMTSLPESITGLWHLQVLKIDNCMELQSLPNGMRKLVNLVELCNADNVGLTKMPKGIGQLTKLRRLSFFKANTSASLKELRGLCNIRGKLKIYISKAAVVQCEESILENTTGLVELLLGWETGGPADIETLNALKPHEDIETIRIYEYGSSSFPDWFLRLSALSEIQLNACENIRELSHLHLAPSLRKLHIEEMNLEYVDSCGCEKSYNKLEKIHLQNCEKLKGWCAPQGTVQFPVLSELFVIDCPEFEFFPDTSAKIINFGGCPKLTLAEVPSKHILLGVDVDLKDCEVANAYHEFLNSIEGIDKWYLSGSDTLILGQASPEFVLSKFRQRGYFAEIKSVEPF